jgi:hypothetical protein
MHIEKHIRYSNSLDAIVQKTIFSDIDDSLYTTQQENNKIARARSCFCGEPDGSERFAAL